MAVNERLVAAAGERELLPNALVISSLSRALDLAEGEPMGHSIRACWLAMRIAKWLDLPDGESHDLFYGVLLKDAGCSANAHSVSGWFQADDQPTKAQTKLVDWSHKWQAMLFAIRQSAPSAPITRRLARLAALGVRGPSLHRELVDVRCNRGAQLVRQLGWGEPAASAVLALDEHWDGRGEPLGLTGEEIPLLARIALLCQTVEVFFRLGGSEGVATVLRRRRGRWFDPELVDLFLARTDDGRLWEELDGTWHPRHVFALDPRPRPEIPGSLEQLLQVGEVFAAVVDAKSPWTNTHSARTAAIARTLSGRLGLDEAAQDRMGLAGMLHDLGKLGVSNAILDKPGRLDAPEMAEMQRHTSVTYEILSPLRAVRQVAEVAAAHHERLDGSGYHRGLRSGELPDGATILAVADTYEALTATRPYRTASTPGQALRLMRRESEGRLDPSALAALGELVAASDPGFA